MESVVLDQGWFEKWRGPEPKGRFPLDEYQRTEINELSRKKFVVFGEKEDLLQVLFHFGPVASLTVPVEKRSEIERMVEELKRAKSTGGI